MKKKIIIGTMALFFCFVALGAVQVRGEESTIREEMAALEEMLKNLAEQLGTTPEVPGTKVSIEGIPANFTFNQNLTQGARGVGVRYLQILLNADPDTRLEQSGAGSPGNETEYFGPITRAAVNKFQSKYASEILNPIGLNLPTGFVGAQTRAKINAILRDGVTETPSVPSSILNALKEISDAIKDLSKRVDALYGTPSGDEGEISVEVRADIRNAEVAANQTKEVAVFRVKAEDSSVTIQRIDLYFNHSGDHSVTATEFRRYIDSIAIYSGNEKLREIKLSTSLPHRDDKYISFSGLTLVVPRGGYKDITVEVKGTNRDENKLLEIGLTDSMAVRGVDGAGVTQYAGGSTIRRSFTFTGEEMGALEIKRHADNPAEGVVMISATSRTQVDLLKFTLTAKDADIELDNLTVLIEKGDTTLNMSDILQDVVLYKGTQNLDYASVNTSTGKATFDGLGITIEKGKTETFTIKAEALATEVAKQGASLTATIEKSDNEEVGFNVNDEDISIDGTVRGNKQHLYVIAPEIDLTLASIERIEITKDSNDRAVGEIEFTLKAVGGRVYFEKKENVNNDGEGMLDLDGFPLVFASLTSNAKSATNPIGLTGSYYYLLKDESKTFELEFETTNVDVRDRVEVKSLRWIVEDKNGNAVEFEWTGEFVEMLKTNRVSLYWTTL